MRHEIIAVLLVPPLVKQYLINYARTLICTTSLSYANIVSANCSFHILESGRTDKVRLLLRNALGLLSG